MALYLDDAPVAADALSPPGPKIVAMLGFQRLIDGRPLAETNIIG